VEHPHPERLVGRPDHVSITDRGLMGAAPEREGVLIVTEEVGGAPRGFEVRRAQRQLAIGLPKGVVGLRPRVAVERRAGAGDVVGSGHRASRIQIHTPIHPDRAWPSLQPAAPPEQHDETE
jgi:hypothetical protein